jgi:triosephosphate isomerase
MRRAFIAGNWKMNTSIFQAVDLARSLAEGLTDVRDRDIMVAPHFLAIPAVCQVLAGSNISVGAQDVFWEEEGAYTGEVSSSMLKDAGCSYVIVGHSERRQYFQESDDVVNSKVTAVLRSGLSVVMCLGESLEERDSGRTLPVIARQLKEGTRGLEPPLLERFILAYEPVWAIGTGRTAAPEQVLEAHAFLRKNLTDLFGGEIAETVRILYGGSVKPANISELMAGRDIDGALVGGASLKADSFIDIVKF